MLDPATDSLQYLAPPSLDDRLLTDRQRQVLERVNQRVAANESLEQVIDFLFEETAEICPCDRIAIAFLVDDDQRIASHYVRARYEPVRLGPGYVEDVQQSSLGRVIEAGRCRIINDLRQYLEAHPDSRSTRLLVDEGVRSSMTCPLRVEDRVVGVLFRSSRRPGSYDAHLVAVHLAVAERLSQAVEKVRRIEQLEAANRNYTEMLGFVSHELKSPVSSMVTDATVLSEGYVGALTDNQREVLGRLIRKGNHLLSMVREYLDLARIEGGQMEIRPRRDVNFVAEVVEPSLDVVAAQIEVKGMAVERRLAEGMPPVECDPELLKVVLINYLSNGAKYGREGGRLAVRAELADGKLVCAVRNEGEGFPPDQRKHLFRKFSRLSLPAYKDRKGTGVGLYSVWKIVRLHGGRVDATSDPGAWAEFSLEIPQPLPPVSTADDVERPQA